MHFALPKKFAPPWNFAAPVNMALPKSLVPPKHDSFLTGLLAAGGAIFAGLLIGAWLIPSLFLGGVSAPTRAPSKLEQHAVDRQARAITPDEPAAASQPVTPAANQPEP